MVEDARLELRERLHIVPADIDLSTVEQSLDGAERRVRRLVERFSLSDMPYDLVIIDNPPNVGVLTFNALMASGEAIVPIDAGRLTLDAVNRFRETLDILAEERGHRVKMHVLPSCFDVRTRYAREILEEIDTLYPGERLSTLLHQTVRLKEAAAAGEAIDSFDGNSRGAKDFDELAHEVYSLAADLHVEDSVRASELLMGPAPRRPAGLVSLSAAFQDAESVAVTGDFTDWSVEGMPMRPREDGVWELELDVEPGCYEYKFIVDGVWKVDPQNPERVRNNYGQLNSILVVPSADEA
jgi:cellulose biosynthesis protein BcsQ